MRMKKPILLTLLLCSILQAQAATPENTTTSAVTVLRQAYDTGLATYPEVLQEEISALEAEVLVDGEVVTDNLEVHL